MKTKRFTVAVVLLCGILVTCSLALWDLYRGLGRLNALLSEMSAIPPEQQELLIERSEAMQEEWNKEEGRFVLYVSHGTLDHITQMVAELPALARYGEYSHLYSHLDAIEALLDDLWQSSIPTYRTLL